MRFMDLQATDQTFQSVTQKNEHLHTSGCYDKLIVYLERNALILGGVAACVPFLLVIGIVVVFCMCARVTKVDDEDDGYDV